MMIGDGHINIADKVVTGIFSYKKRIALPFGNQWPLYYKK